MLARERWQTFNNSWEKNTIFNEHPVSPSKFDVLLPECLIEDIEEGDGRYGVDRLGVSPAQRFLLLAGERRRRRGDGRGAGVLGDGAAAHQPGIGFV